LLHREVFEHEYYRLPLARLPATILDVGAGIGLTAVYFSRLFPDARLACVEPAPDNLCLLERNLKLNGVRASVFPAAIDAADRRLLMQQGAKYLASSLESGLKPGLYVATTSIPKILGRLGWDHVGLLKVDIHGAEPDLLSGPTEWISLVDTLCIKCHAGFGDVQLRELASGFGFLPPP
jgi:FkbM family methyltransferase